MAIRLMTGNPLRLIKKTEPLKQKFNYLLVLDFEATCVKEVAIDHPEIIEFPCLAINTKDWKIENAFHKYIKPRINPELSAHCTDLTGITQDIVDDEEHFSTVFDEFNNWLEINQYIKDENQSAFVTCGDWDLKVMLPAQCQQENLILPKYFERWINLKKSYYDATKYFPKSIKDMLMRMRLPFEGKLHSGLHDTINMSKVINELVKKNNAIFQLTTTGKHKKIETDINKFSN